MLHSFGPSTKPRKSAKMAPLEILQGNVFVNNVLLHDMQSRRRQRCSWWKLLMFAAFGSDQVWITSIPQTGGTRVCLYWDRKPVRANWCESKRNCCVHTGSTESHRSPKFTKILPVWVSVLLWCQLFKLPLPPLNNGLQSAWVVINFILLHFVVTNQKYMSKKKGNQKY